MSFRNELSPHYEAHCLTSAGPDARRAAARRHRPAVRAWPLVRCARPPLRHLPPKEKAQPVSNERPDAVTRARVIERSRGLYFAFRLSYLVLVLALGYLGVWEV
eukprot:scaffold36833_cov100-Phaeocystis_antarctica.AAC.3